MFDFPLHRAETWALLWLWMAVPFAEHGLSSNRRPCLAALRYPVALLLVVVGACLAFAQVASSYWLGQGQSMEREGRVEAARDAYRSALRWDRASPDANFSFVRAMAKTGDLSGALAQSHVASRFVNEPELIILRSRIQQNAGHHDQAIGELHTGIRTFPYSEELRDELVSYSSVDATATGR
jgi:tetratricopeptide (TPR) repeat protein